MKRLLLGDIASIASGGTPSRSNPEFWGGDIPWVKTGEVQFNRIKDTDEKITLAGVAGSATKIFPKDTLLMAMYGQGKTRGQVAILEIDAAINQACAAITLQSPEDTAYVYHYLAFNYQNIRKLSNSGSQENLSADLIRSIPIHYPVQDERSKIADILSTWDEALETLDALIAAKDCQKQALMQQLLTGKTRVKGAKGKVNFVRASELFTNRSERNSNSLPILSVTQDQGVVLRSALERRIAHDEETNGSYKVVRKGDFVISLRSFQGGLEYSDMEGAVSPAYHIIHPRIDLDSLFFKHYFKSADFVSRLATAVIGIRDGKQINFTDFGFIKLPFPPVEEQHRTGLLLETTDQELALLRAQRQTLDQQKRGLMQRLLTGKTRVKTP